MKHQIPLGTKVTFEGGSQVYVVDSYQTLLHCDPSGDDCSVHMGEDCYYEPFVCVRQESWTAFPLSKLKTIFLPNGIGREATFEDKLVKED